MYYITIIGQIILAIKTDMIGKFRMAITDGHFVVMATGSCDGSFSDRHCFFRIGIASSCNYSHLNLN
jgi:hypothetical protein